MRALPNQRESGPRTVPILRPHAAGMGEGVTEFVYDDGGRKEAGYRGDTGDCVTRAIAIATQDDYRRVYDVLHGIALDRGARGRKASPRNGVTRKDYDRYLTAIGWVWTPTMQIGSVRAAVERRRPAARGRASGAA